MGCVQRIKSSPATALAAAGDGDMGIGTSTHRFSSVIVPILYPYTTLVLRDQAVRDVWGARGRRRRVSD